MGVRDKGTHTHFHTQREELEALCEYSALPKEQALLTLCGRYLYIVQSTPHYVGAILPVRAAHVIRWR